MSTDTTTNYHYRVQYDLDPDLSYLEQEEFNDVEPQDIVSYVVTQERLCPCCDQWGYVLGIGGCDVEIGSNDDIGPGVYALDELPEFMAAHFSGDV